MTHDDPRLFEDDGLLLPEVGSWTTTKHRKLSYYCSLFASSMKKKWDCRVYVDLFACAGKCKLRESAKIVPGSPLLALNVDVPFEKYVFCEADPENMSALQARVEKYFPDKDCSFILGNVNRSLEKLFDAIPKFTREFKGLTLCFVDPYRIGDLDFFTLRQIAERLYVDFLVLIPSYMDIGRNEANYTRDDNTSLDKYLGTSSWRVAWAERERRTQKFGIFIADQFCNRMKELRYLYEGLEDLELVRGTEKNLALYHLGFFSRSDLGRRFWQETRNRTDNQRTIWKFV